MADDEGLAWIPAQGAHLTRAELAEIMRTLRALIAGTAQDDPTQAYAVSIAYIVTTAMDRAGGAR